MRSSHLTGADTSESMVSPRALDEPRQQPHVTVVMTGLPGYSTPESVSDILARNGLPQHIARRVEKVTYEMQACHSVFPLGFIMGKTISKKKIGSSVTFCGFGQVEVGSYISAYFEPLWCQNDRKTCLPTEDCEKWLVTEN